MMPVPSILLVPTDFSETAEYALDYAIAIAAKLGARVHVVNVIGVPTLGVPDLGIAVASTTIGQYLRDNQALLEQLLATRHGQVAFGEPILRTGDARTEILRCVDELGADLLVMGTHGRRGLSRALLGSVAESIVRTAPCPVLTIRQKAGTP